MISFQTVSIFSITSLLCFTAFACCEKDCLDPDHCFTSEGIQGRWIWVKSIGGFTGGTITPESTGQTETVVIDDFHFSRFIDGVKTSERQYDVEIRPDSSHGTNTFIVFDTGELPYILAGDDLEIIETCPDCYHQFYERSH